MSTSNTIKQRVKRFLRPGAHVALTAYSYTSDFVKYMKHSVRTGIPRGQEQHSAMLTMEFHSIEKGLSLKSPRLGFGKRRIHNILRLLKKGEVRGWSGAEISQSKCALREYVDRGFFDGTPHELNQLASLPADSGRSAGTRLVEREDTLRRCQIDLEEFFFSRSSVRHFANREVSMCDIDKAIRLAQKTPSVCNRQASEVFVITGETAIQRALEYQNGNGGFGDQADKLLLITSNLQRFTGPGERFQPWIDGGMFAMSVVYALHSLGLGTCCLNLSLPAHKQQRLKRALSLPDYVMPLMFIAVGHLPDQYRVASSPLRELNQIRHIMDSALPIDSR